MSIECSPCLASHPGTYAAFAANDVELVFGRWDPDDDIDSWQSVGVVISELRRDTCQSSRSLFCSLCFTKANLVAECE